MCNYKREIAAGALNWDSFHFGFHIQQRINSVAGFEVARIFGHVESVEYHDMGHYGIIINTRNIKYARHVSEFFAR